MTRKSITTQVCDVKIRRTSFFCHTKQKSVSDVILYNYNQNVQHCVKCCNSEFVLSCAKCIWTSSFIRSEAILNVLNITIIFFFRKNYWHAWLCLIFRNYVLNGTISVLNVFGSSCVFYFLYNVYLKLLYFRKNWAKYHKSAYVFQGKCVFLGPKPPLKFYKNSSHERWVLCGQTDMMKLIVTKSNFGNACKWNLHTVFSCFGDCELDLYTNE